MLFFDRPGTVDTKYSLYTTSAVTPKGRLDFRRLPIAYRDFSQNAQNVQKVLQNGVPPKKHDLARYTPHINFGTWAEVRLSLVFGDADVRKNAFGPPSRPQGGVYTWLNLKIVFFRGVPHFGALFGHFGHLAEIMVRYW